MADKKINDLPALATQVSTDVYEMSNNAATLSSKETRAQMLSYFQTNITNPAQIIYINAASGSDTTGNGSLSNPYATYEKARTVAILAATAAIPYSIVPIGRFNITGNLTLSPFVNISGLGPGSSRFVITGSMILSAAFDSTASASSYIKDIYFESTSIACTFGVSQNARLHFDNVDVSNTGSIAFTGTGSEIVIMEKGITLSSMPAITATNVTFGIFNANAGNVTFINSIATDTSFYLQANVSSNIGNIILRNTSTGDVFGYITANGGSIPALTLDGTLVHLDIDSSSYSVEPTYLNSATAAQITLISLSDGIDANYTPINYVPNDDSVHGHLIGIDNALGGDEPGGESLQDAYDTGDDAIITMDASRPVVFQTSSNGAATNAITTQGTGSSSSPVYRVIGYRFTPSVDMQVTELQYDDALMVSTTFGHDTAIYNFTTFEELGRVTIYKTDPLDPSTVYRTKTLNSPILLQGGTEYVFATVQNINEFVYTNKSVTPNASVTLSELAQLPQSSTGVSLQFPQTFTPATPNQAYLGSFVFETLSVSESININDGTTSTNKIFDIVSTARASVPAPVMTTAQMNAIGTPAAGMQIFNSNSTPIAPHFYNGSAWINILNASVSATITVTNTSASASYFIPIITASATADYPLYVGVGLSFNPNTNILSTTGANFSGLTASSLVATDGSKNLTSTTSSLIPQLQGVQLYKNGSIAVTDFLRLGDTSQAANAKYWGFGPSGLSLYGYTINDAFSSSANWIQVTRSAGSTTVASVAFPNGNVNISSLTASKLVTTDSSKNLSTPSYLVYNDTASIGTATPNLGVSKSESGGVVMINCRNTSNTANSSSKIDCRVGGSSAADPYYACDIDGIGGWSMGLDNSDSDSFKIDRGAPASPGSNTFMAITTAGVYTFTTTQDNGGFTFKSTGGSVYRDLVRNASTGLAQDVYSTTTTNHWNTGLVTGSSNNYAIRDAANAINVMTCTPGTTAATNFLGRVTAIEQPAFSAFVNANVNDVTGDGTAYTVLFNSEIFDQNSNYATGTGIFTAPVTGRYRFNCSIIVLQCDAGHTEGWIDFVSSNRTYTSGETNPSKIFVTGGYVSFVGTVFADMDAADTMKINLTINGGTKTVDLRGDATGILSYFAGELVC